MERVVPHRVEHLQNFVLFAGVQSIDDDRQPCLMLREAVDGLGHPRHQLHLVLQDLPVDTFRLILHLLMISVTFSTPASSCVELSYTNIKFSFAYSYCWSSCRRDTDATVTVAVLWFIYFKPSPS